MTALPPPSQTSPSKRTPAVAPSLWNMTEGSSPHLLRQGFLLDADEQSPLLMNDRPGAGVWPGEAHRLVEAARVVVPVRLSAARQRVEGISRLIDEGADHGARFLSL